MPEKPPVPSPEPENSSDAGTGADRPTDDTKAGEQAEGKDGSPEEPDAEPKPGQGAGAGGGGPPDGGTPSVIDLSQVKPFSPKPAPVAPAPMGPIPRAGVTLSKWVLVMISVFVLFSVIWIWSSEGVANQHIWELAKPGAQGGTGDADQLTAFYKNVTDFREFWLKMFQMVLLNALLPVLTALLGYVFGSAQRGSEQLEPPRSP